MGVVRVVRAEKGTHDRVGDSTKLNGYNYKEVQIHGPINLRSHVKKLVVHPRHRVDGWDEERIRALCKVHGWEFIWMDDERQLRVVEDRANADGKVLEMSWSSNTLPEITAEEALPLTPH